MRGRELKVNRKPLFPAAAIGLALACMLPPGASAADERESLEALRQTTLGLIEALVEQGVISREKADAMVKTAQQKAAVVAKEKPAAPGTVRVPYVPEVVKSEIREQLKQEVLAQAKNERWAEPNAIPSWLDSIKWEGDIRLRYQSDRFAGDNTLPADYDTEALTVGATRAADFISPSANTTERRERSRLRARLGMLGKVSESWSAGIRLATGSTTDRVSTNQTLGQDWNKYTLLVDRAYVKFDPVEWLSVTGGRIPNPWFSTDLVWDEDLNFEGIAATLKPVFANGAVKPFLTVGSFPLKEENPPASTGRWMHGVQAGAQLDFSSDTRFKFGLGAYEFDSLEGRVEKDADYFTSLLPGGNPVYGQYQYARSLRQKGNTLFDTSSPTHYFIQTAATSLWGLASRFRPINLTASLDLAHFDPVHVVLTGDWVKNDAFDRAEIARRTQGRVVLTDGKDYGYQYKLTVGMPQLKNARDWQVSLASRYLGSDATLDAFTDSDFGLGGTNMKGHVFAMQYAVDRNAVLGLRWVSADSIDSFTLNPAHRYSVDVLQADVNVRF